MQVVDISAELKALADTAAEACSKELSVATKKRFSLSVIHLTVILRTIRSKQGQTSFPELDNFLLQTVPCALSAFNSALRTYSLNTEVCQQTTVLLGSLLGVARPSSRSNFYAAALQNLLDAIPHCFFTLASAGRKEDVRPLLNAVVMVAGGSAKQKAPNFCFSDFIPSPPFWRNGPIAKEDTFIIVLRSILGGWIAAKQNLVRWSTVDYLDVAEAVSVALTMKLESGQEEHNVKHLTSAIRTAARSVVCSSREARGSLIHFAFASGVMRAVEGYPLDADHQFKEELSQSMRVIVEQKMASLTSFANRKSIATFSEIDTETISMTFLVLRVARSLSNALTSQQVQAFCSAIEALISSVAEVDIKADKQLSLLHSQLLWCINSNSVMLGYAYAALKTNSNVQFLRELADLYPSNAAVTRFTSAATLRWKSSPSIAAELADILSLFSNKTPTIFSLCAPRLIPVISENFGSISCLVGLAIALLEQDKTVAHLPRSLFLLDTIRLSLLFRRRTEDLSSEGASKIPQQKRTKLWIEFAAALQQAIVLHVQNETFSYKCIECLKEMLASEEQPLQSARNHLTVSFPSLLLENYLFEGEGKIEKRRLLHVAKVFDVIAERNMDEFIVKDLIDSLLESSKKFSGERNRLIGVLLLRFLGRCGYELFDVVSDGVSRFIGSDRQRKLQFLPLARLAVLGMDMLRKRKSVEWVLLFFTDVSGIGKERDVDFSREMSAKL